MAAKSVGRLGQRAGVTGGAELSPYSSSVEVPTECWLHPGVEVALSPIAGIGLFARTGLEYGAVVARLGGVVVDEHELRRRLDERAATPTMPYIDTISLIHNTHLVLPHGTLVRFGNHSCDPNLWWRDALSLVARRDVRPGEEVTNDYATSTALADFRMTCACGSENCRRVITGEDWRRDDLRVAYGEHWTPALLARVHAERQG